MSAEVRVKDLEVTFGKKSGESVTAIRDLSVTIPAGDFVSIVGPSGCGKTTLLRVIAGLQDVTHGHVLVDGEEVRAPRKDTCVMFQSPTLLPWLTVLKNCLLPRSLRGGADDADVDAARRLLMRAGLGGFEDAHPHELSGGMQQRVALCRALSADPKLLLLDEPFGALDAMTREQMNLDLHKMWEENVISTLLITHSITEAVFLSQRVIVLSSRPGRVVEVVDVPLPRKRDVSVLDTDEYSRTCARIRAHFVKEDANVVE